MYACMVYVLLEFYLDNAHHQSLGHVTTSTQRQGMSDTDSGVVYDVAVVGAGVIGSAAACNIIRKGANVVLIEQVP